jgi:ABC-2 type transport system permease protein
MLGKLLPGTVMGIVQGGFVLGLAVFAFSVPVAGSVLAFTALFPLFALTHLVIGFAISSGSKTQLAALQGAVAFYLPAMLLSGFLYPFATLPGWAQAIGNLFPLSHFIRAAQGALLRGDDAGAILMHGLPIAGVLVVCAGLSMLLVRRSP